MTDINKYKKRFNQLACIEDTYLINFMICSQNFIADLVIKNKMWSNESES